MKNGLHRHRLAQSRHELFLFIAVLTAGCARPASPIGVTVSAQEPHPQINDNPEGLASSGFRPTRVIGFGLGYTCLSDGEMVACSDSSLQIVSGPIEACQGGVEGVSILASRDHVLVLCSNGAMIEANLLSDELRFARIGTPIHTRSVASGNRHFCNVDVHGGLECTGDNSRCQLGTSDTGSQRHRPLEGANVSMVTAGSEHSCALDGSRSLWCWGQVGGVQLCEPRRMADNVSSVSSSSEGVCFIDDDREVHCIGVRFDESSEGVRAFSPFGDTEVQSMHLSRDVVCAVRSSDDALMCWPHCGNREMRAAPAPTHRVRVVPPCSSRVVQGDIDDVLSGDAVCWRAQDAWVCSHSGSKLEALLRRSGESSRR